MSGFCPLSGSFKSCDANNSWDFLDESYYNRYCSTSHYITCPRYIESNRENTYEYNFVQLQQRHIELQDNYQQLQNDYQGLRTKYNELAKEQSQQKNLLKQEQQLLKDKTDSYNQFKRCHDHHREVLRSIIQEQCTLLMSIKDAVDSLHENVMKRSKAIEPFHEFVFGDQQFSQIENIEEKVRSAALALSRAIGGTRGAYEDVVELFEEFKTDLEARFGSDCLPLRLLKQIEEDNAID